MAAPPFVRPYEASDEPRLFQLAQHHSGGRTIKTERLGEGNLVEARPVFEHRQNPVLGVGDAKLSGFLQEKRHGNLLCPANEEAWPQIQFCERVLGRWRHAIAKRDWTPRSRRSRRGEPGPSSRSIDNCR